MQKRKKTPTTKQRTRAELDVSLLHLFRCTTELLDEIDALPPRTKQEWEAYELLNGAKARVAFARALLLHESAEA